MRLIKEARINLLRGSGLDSRPTSESVRSLNSNTKARYFPFGMGKHTCLGQPHASWLTMTITSTIINHFDMEIDDVAGLLDKECSYQRIKDHVYTSPKAPFKAIITPLDAKPRKLSKRESLSASMLNFSLCSSKDFFNIDPDDEF